MMGNTFKCIVTCLLALPLSFLSLTAALAQSMVCGTVVEKGSGEAVEGVNVMVRLGSGTILGYDITSPDGRYSVEYTTDADSVMVHVTGFNIKPASVQIATGTGQADFRVEYARQKIREVKVTASTIKRQGDTLTYYVENFRDSTDRSIGDVLKKLPGIEVTSAGGIKYQGKPINRFYIEGLDMLGGRYGIATKNVQAKDIAAVEVYENHQPIKILQDWIKSDNAAINLRLKSSAKGTWNAVLQAGAGYRPWLWNGEAAPMFFGKDFQTISTYKTNNTGDDVSLELTSHYGGVDGSSSLLHVSAPQTPPLSKDRYLDNRIHALSVNTITRLGKDTDLTADASYIHDDQSSRGNSMTTYHLPNGNPLVIMEDAYAGHRTDRLGVNLQFRTNSSKTYLIERISFDGEKVSDAGVLSDGVSGMEQGLSRPRATVKNSLQMVKRLDDWRINLYSNTDWDMQSSTLSVNPTPYPEIFGSVGEDASAVQSLQSSRLRTDNRFNASYFKGHWSLSLNAGVKYHWERMASSLHAVGMDGAAMQPADSMRNSIDWHRLDITAGPSLFYRIGKRLEVNLNVPMDIMNIGSIDHVAGNGMGSTSILVSPTFSVKSDITYNLKVNAYASWKEYAGDIYDLYSGYVMTGYRMVGKKVGIPLRTRIQNASIDISYASALNALFMNASASWWRRRSNVTLGTDYSGTLAVTTATESPDVVQGINTSGRISKRIGSMSTILSISGSWGRRWYEYLRQGVLMPTVSDNAGAGLSLDSRLGSWAVLSYEGNYTRSTTRINGEMMDPIDMLTQSADISFTVIKGFILKAGGEHYFNASIDGSDRHMFFLDASLSFRKGRFEYILEGRNLLDSRTFSSAVYNDITSFVYTTSIRPVSVMLKVRFSLR